MELDVYLAEQLKFNAPVERAILCIGNTTADGRVGQDIRCFPASIHLHSAQSHCKSGAKIHSLGNSSPTGSILYKMAAFFFVGATV